MRELTEEAADHLSIIHREDVRKVMEQLKAVSDNREYVLALQDLTEEEYSQFIMLIEKYFLMISKIK